MNNEALKAFFHDKAAQKAWADFIIYYLDQEAVDRVRKGKDVTGLKEARDIISRSFKELNQLFSEKTKVQVENRGV